MKIGKYDVLIMRLESRAWDFNEQSGTSYTIHFMSEGRVYKAKITKVLYDEYSDVVQKEGSISLVLESYNSVLKLSCVDIDL